MANETIGQRIAQRRKMLNLSQEALGDQLEVSRQAVSKWESDAAIPEIEKLVTMSRLFGVSVGWLLGVEEEQPEPEAEESANVPKGQKRILILAAVCTAVSLIVAGFALHRAATLEKKLRQQTTALELLSAQTLTGGVLLSEYYYDYTPWQNLNGADFAFTGVPMSYVEGSTCEIVAYLEEQEVSRVQCGWDGHQYTAELSLAAADGYRCYLVQTLPGGIQRQEEVTTAVLAKLERNLSVDYMVNVDCAWMSLGDNSLLLQDMTFRVNLPNTFNGTAGLWKKFDLVLSSNGDEIGRIDLLNRSQYSAAIDFAGADVAFTTQRQSFRIPDTVTVGDELTLALECGLSTGYQFSYEIEAWTVE